MEEKKYEIIEPSNFATIKYNVEDMVHHTKMLAISTSNVKALADVRAKNNKYIKVFDDMIKEAKENLISEVLGTQINAINELIEPLRQANKEFSANLLEADKLRYKEQAKEKFDILNDGGESGEVYDFDEFYEDKWYKKTQIELLEAMQRKLKRIRIKEDVVDKTYFITATNEQFERIDRYLESTGIIFEKVE